MFYREHNRQTEILKGIQIDDPMVFVLWDYNASDTEYCFRNHQLSRVTDEYYVIKAAKLFGTLTCNIGFHFDKSLKRIELFREEYLDLRKSYNDFQKRFEYEFGKPGKREMNPDGFESCEWRFGNKVIIYHDVIDRFGLTEYLCMVRT